MAVLYDTMIKIGVDTSEVDSGMNKAEDSVNSFGNTAKGVFAGNLIYDGVKKLGGAAMGFAQQSIAVGSNFDKAMSQVQATMLKTSEEMENELGTAVIGTGENVKEFNGNLRDFAQFLGANTAFSASQAAEALNYMALAGYDTQQSMDMLPTVLNLAAAGNFDLARASDMVTDAQTAFGLSAERTSLMVDEMAKAASTGNTSVEQLGDAFLVVGGLAQELNGGMVTLANGTQAPVDGIQELEIALTAMANAGVKGSEAGTHMRNMLLKLSSPTDDGVGQLEALGVAVFDTEGKMRSLSDIFGDLSSSLGQLTQEQKIQAISDLFNTRDLASAEALLNAVGQDWDDIGSKILQAEGSAQAMADIQLGNLAGDTVLFQSALEGAQIAISEKLMPLMTSFTQTGAQALQAFTEGFKENGLLGAIESVMPVFANFTATMYSNIMQGLPVIIQAGAELLNNLASGIEQSLPELIPVALNALVEFSGSLRENIGSLVDAGLHLIKVLAKALIDNLPEFIKTVPTIVTNIANIINDNMPKIILTGVEIIGSLIVGIVQSIPTLIAEFPKIIQAIFAVWTAVNWINLGTTLITKIGEGIKYLAANIPKALDGIGRAAFDALKLIQWKSLGSDIIDLIVMGIKFLVNSIPTAMSKIASAALEQFTSLDWYDVGKNIIGGIVSGVTGAASGLANAAVQAVSDAWDAMTSWLDIASPSKKAEKVIGKNWALGIGKGFENFMPVDDMVNAVSDAMDEMDDALPEEVPFDDISVSSFDTGGEKRDKNRVFAPVINVYGSAGQDVNELADEIMDRLTFLYDREEEAYAPA